MFRLVIASIVLVAALFQPSVPYQMMVLNQSWVNVAWVTSPSTAAINIYRNDRLWQASAWLPNQATIWTVNAYAGDQITIVEYSDAGGSEIRHFTTSPVPPSSVPADPIVYLPLMLR